MPARLAFGSLMVLAIGFSASATPQQPAHPSVSQAEAPRSFVEWLADVRKEAIDRGIRREIVDQAFSTVEEPLAVVIERDRAQTEVVMPLEIYLARRLAAANIQTGRQMLVEHGALLKKVEDTYSVPAPTVVAIWGAESNFGRFTGVRPTISALATLAFDRRRPSLFRRELFSALEILDRGDIELVAMRGSWAGAMGQPQFMPSSYLQYAADFDGDGRRDIWDSHSDIFASIANYLKANGWMAGQGWGLEVKLPKEVAAEIEVDVPSRDGSCQARRKMTVALSLEEWHQRGVRLLNGDPLPSADQPPSPASLVSGSSRHFLVYENYDVLLSYNCAHAYALGVALLADQVAGER